MENKKCNLHSVHFFVIFNSMSDLNNQLENDLNNILEDESIMLPPEKKVVFYNDDFTTMDFVVEVLVSIFNKSPVEAQTIMETVHKNGSAVAGTYTYDIAVSRTSLTRTIAKKNGFPLRVEVE